MSQKGKAEAEGAKLCESVAAWVTALGGIPMEVGDIKVSTRGSGKRRCKFMVSVRCNGWMPDLKYEIKK